jgi:hypothetical protein
MKGNGHIIFVHEACHDCQTIHTGKSECFRYTFSRWREITVSSQGVSLGVIKRDEAFLPPRFFMIARWHNFNQSLLEYRLTSIKL